MADITGNTAPIGGGKSLWGTVQCCHELEHSERFIITDIPLIFENPPAGYWTFGDYCHHFVPHPVSISERICVLSAEQACEFWRYLPLAYFARLHQANWTELVEKYQLEVCENEWPHGTSRMIRLPNKPHDLFKLVPDFSFRTAIAENRVGCHYIIDEAHKKFPPMHYQKVGAQAEWYMSELRKLNDDFDWITQHPEKVDKNFRRNCTQWMHFQNMSKASLFMGVSLKNRFRWHWYNQSEIPTRTDKPTSSGWYFLDKKRRYHQLYKTMDGTGVSGGLLSESSMRKGRHPIIWVLAIVAVLTAAYCLPRTIEYVVTHAVKGVVGGVQKGVSNGSKGMMVVPPPGTNAPPPVIHPRPISSVRAPADPASVAVQTPPDANGGLTCTGTMQLPGGDQAVMMSDGRVLYRSEGDVEDIGRHWVKIRGLGPIPRSQSH